MAGVGIRTLTATDLYDVTTTQQDELGAVGTTDNGRVFRYAKVGAAALTAGAQTSPAAAVANHGNREPQAAQAGSRVVVLTVGATAVTEGQYNEGSLAVIDGLGEGAVYKVTGHTVAPSSGTVTVYLDDRLATNLDSTSRVSLVKNVYDTLRAATSGQVAAGVPNVELPANGFGWVQTQGPAVVGGAYAVLGTTNVS